MKKVALVGGFFLFIAGICCSILELIPLFIACLPALVIVGLLIYGSACICSQMFVPALCQLPHPEGTLLTFDDGPHPLYTPKVLSILREKNVKAAFFPIGRKVKQHPDIVKQIHQEGHVIGNHSMLHRWYYGFLPARRLAQDVREFNTLLREITGQEPTLFRPPYGVTNPPLAKALGRFPWLRVLGWTLRTRDTVHRNPHRIVQLIKKRAKPGHIILLHDRCAATAEALPEIIDYLQATPSLRPVAAEF